MWWFATTGPRPPTHGRPSRPRHGLHGRIASDGTEHGLTVGGSPAEVAAYLRGYHDIGVGEVIVVFRDPFDLETIGRLGELREALGSFA